MGDQYVLMDLDMLARFAGAWGMNKEREEDE